MPISDGASRISALDGDSFRRFVAAGAVCLERNVEAINALNVFPVPDGDTGINMMLTLRDAQRSPEMPALGTGTVAQVSHAISRGALLGARGNSGVIFSQFFKGFASSLQGSDTCDGVALAKGLASGVDAAYKAVSKPVEGTILSVMRAAAEAVQHERGDVPGVWQRACVAAQSALERTPEQLPVLKQAGVVDAGGQGLVAFMVGGLAYLQGKDPATALQLATPAAATGKERALVSQEFLEHTENDIYGYCTQVLIRGNGLSVDDIRQRIAAMGRSTVVVGDDTLVKIHVHALDPGPVLSLGVSIGAIDQVKIENMDTMHHDFMAQHGYVPAVRAPLAVVAVAQGDGLERIFRDQGAAVIIKGGQTMNPSAQDILLAVQEASAEHVVILPNNSNIILAAQQAVSLSDIPCTVVPSRTIPQGIAALLAFNRERDTAANLEAMKRAITTPLSGEVTIAVRDSVVDGQPVKAGEAIGFLEDKLVSVTTSAKEAAVALIERANPADGSLITIYWGATSTPATASAVVERLRERWPNVDVEVIPGGQPHYHYLLSIE